MTAHTPQLIAILKRYAADADLLLTGETRLCDLGIEDLDLSMIGLDIEDTFHITIGFNDDIEDAATIVGLAGWVQERQDAKAQQARLRAQLPREKSNWMSTGNERRR